MKYPLFQVRVTMKHPGGAEEKVIRYLEKGEFFGEKALQGWVRFLFPLPISNF